MNFSGLFKKKYKWEKYYTKEQLETCLNTPDASIYDLFAEVATKYSKKVALDYFGKEITFGNFLESVDKVARAFQYYGVEEDDIVTICMPNTPESLISFYALNKIGAIANMIHPLSGEAEMKHYLKNTNSKMLLMIDVCYEKIKNVINETNVKRTVVVSAKDSMPFFLGLGYLFTKGIRVKKPKSSDRYIYWAEFLLKSYKVGKNPGVKRKKTDLAVILNSGGTTGVPKGVVHSNDAFTTLALQSRIVVDIGPKDSVLVIMPNFHGFGLGLCMNFALLYGSKLILVPQFNVKTFDKLILKNKPTLVVGVPTLFEALVGHAGLQKADLSFIRYLVSGGDSLNKALWNRMDEFMKEHGSSAEIIQGYGMTEALAAVAGSFGEHNAVASIGIPLCGNEIKICVPGTQDEVPPGEDGEICVTGKTVMQGYLNNKKETNECLQLHKDKKIWLHSGDAGYMTEEGIIYFQQRLKRLIVSSGYNIYPSHIEEVIEQHPAVLKCTVIGIPHKYKVQVAKAYIVLEEGYEDSWSVKKGIKERCEKYLAEYSQPYDYEFRKSLPTTLLGKVNFRQLEEESRQEKSEEE